MSEPFRNVFRWSVSRDQTFLDCPRRYYFQYYGSWGGWDPSSSDRTRRLYVLKNLKTRAMWVGEVVHDCIRRSLENLSRSIEVLPTQRILEITLDRMRRDFRQSRAGEYRRAPKKICGLFEHEYGIDVSKDEWRECSDRAQTSLRTFYDSPVYREFIALEAEQFLEIESFSQAALDDIQLVVKLDCAVRRNDGVIVWDWKTGVKPGRNADFQMAVYAYYASDKFGVPVDHVETRRFELSQNEVVSRVITPAQVTEHLSYIRGSVGDMLALLDNAEKNTASEKRFAKTDRLAACGRCNFLGVCRPELTPGYTRSPRSC